MTANRTPPTLSNTPLGIGGSDYATRIAEELIALYGGRVNQVTGVAGTNTITGVCTPPLQTAYAHGETFRFTPAGSNTGAVTVNWDSKGAVDLKSEDNAALVTGDIISGVPVMCWYDSSIGDMRLMQRLMSKIASELTDDIAALSVWKELGHTVVGAPVSSVVHTFTADAYTLVKVVGRGITTATTNNTLRVSLRRSAGEILGATMGSGAINNGDTCGLKVEFIVDNTGSSRRQYVSGEGFYNNNSTGSFPANVSTGAEVSFIPDRIQVNFSSGNIATGEIWTYGAIGS